MSERTTSDIEFSLVSGINPGMHDGPFLVIVEGESSGQLFFGPFRTYGRAEAVVRRVERIAGDTADWSIEALQPGSYAAEWARIIKEDSRNDQ